MLPEQPRIFRDPISKEMAFPIGYELLREHFGTASDWSDARFWFLGRPTARASEFARILRTGEPYRILRLERHFEQFIPSHYPAHWAFTVYPCKSHLKSIVRAALLTQSFGTLQHFMASTPTHAHYYNRIDAIFDPSEGTCRTEQWRPIGTGHVG